VEQVAAALNAAHKVGLVHRDVKPSNILLTNNDFAYLIDFGIARGARDAGLTQTGSAIGTLAYMAPERFSGGQIEPRSDIYALGCVLHECLTGRKPFTGDSIPELIAAHLTAPPPLPSVILPGVPSTFDAVIAKSMAKDFQQRYRTALEFADATHAALAGAGPVGGFALTQGTAESASQQSPPRRHRKAAVITVAITIAAIAISAALVVVTNQQKRDKQLAASASAASSSSSAVAATSSIWQRERKREQQREATQAVRDACGSFAVSSKDAVDKVNDYVAAFNQGRDTTPSQGPAIDALNHSADEAEKMTNGPLPQQLREALNAYSDAARGVAGAIRAHPAPDEFNQRVNQLNDTKSEAINRCQAS
jgi:serine/threonine protein kinase